MRGRRRIWTWVLAGCAALPAQPGAVWARRAEAQPSGGRTRDVPRAKIASRLEAARLPSTAGRQRSDSMAIVALERTWLQTSDTIVLGAILARDFVHIAPGGYVLTRTQHLAWVAAHPRPEGSRRGFERLDVRLYDHTAIATGVVIASDPNERGARRSAFTDVFVERDGRWQAVNAQEDVVVGTR